MQSIIYIILYCILMPLSLGAVLLNLVGLPGNWVVLVSALVLSWMRGWTSPGLLTLALFTVVVLAGDVGEIMASAAGAKKFGAGKGAAFAAMGGGLVGAIVGVPVPIFGSLIGAIVGAFLGALICEVYRTRSLGKGSWAALGAALGRVVGMMLRVVCGFAVWIAVVITTFPTR